MTMSDGSQGGYSGSTGFVGGGTGLVVEVVAEDMLEDCIVLGEVVVKKHKRWTGDEEIYGGSRAVVVWGDGCLFCSRLECRAHSITEVVAGYRWTELVEDGWQFQALWLLLLLLFSWLGCKARSI